MYPCASRTLFMRDTCKGIYALAGDDIFQIDEVARTILGLCDGTHTGPDIVDALRLHLEEDDPELEHDVAEFLGSMVSAGVIRMQPEPARCEPVYRNDHPCGATIEVTWNCNLKCSFCVASAGDPVADEMSSHEYESLLAQLGQWGPAPVNITGGEALLRPQVVLDIGRMARQNGLEPLLITNATLVDDAMALALQKAGFRDVQVSIDSPREEVHDAGRGVPGSLQKTRQGIEALRAAGFNVSIAAVISRGNIDHEEEILQMAGEFGNHTKVSEILPLGRGHHHPDLLTPEQLLEHLTRVHRLPDGSLGKRLMPLERCSAGTVPVITPSGDVFPCFSLRFPAFRVGNVRSQSLREMWLSSPILKELFGWTINDVEGCRDCRNRLVCGGGCRAIAYSYHGTIYRPDSYHCSASKMFTAELLHHGDEQTRRTLIDLLEVEPGLDACQTEARRDA